MGRLIFTDADELRFNVAKRLGWNRLRYGVYGQLLGCPPGKTRIELVPPFATSQSAAWELVTHLTARHLRVKIENDAYAAPIRSYTIRLGPVELGIVVSDPDFCSAICSAFLRLPPDLLNPRTTAASGRFLTA